jgi:hypothetical protein
MTVLSDELEQAADERPLGAGPATASRRSVLAGLAVLPVIAWVGTAAPAAATPTPDPGDATTRGTLVLRAPVHGTERRYHAPMLTPGTRLVLPAGLSAVPIQDFYRRPHLAPSRSNWPHLRATNGSTVDASIIPGPGAPTRVAVLHGFTEGWYELRHATGRSDRVTWDARAFPFLWLYGEFGGANEAPYRDRFFTLALQPLSHNPYRSA